MKKLFAFILAGMLACVMAFSLLGCGGISGKYVATTITYGGTEFDWSEITNTECYITFDNGSYEFSIEGGTATGSYTEDGNSISMEIEGVDVTAVLDGTKLTMDFPEGTISTNSESGIIFEKE